MVIGIGLNLWPGRAGTPPEPVPAVAQPSITSPVDDAVDVSLTPTLTSSAFSVTNEGSDTHASSDWQVAEDSGFSMIAAESLDDATNKVSWTVPSALANETEYFARVRHTGATLGDGPWSSPVSFTTIIAGAEYSFTNAEAEAFIAAFAAEPENWYKERIDTCVSDLKTAGLWSTRDAIWPMWAPSGEGSDGFLLNLKNPAAFKLIPVNGPTFTPYAGGAGNGTNSYYNTGWDAATNGVNYTRNNGSLGCWIDAGSDTGAPVSPMGAVNATETSGARIIPRSSSNFIAAAVNGAVVSLGSIATRYGLTSVERIAASGSGAVVGYRNGSANGSATSTSAALTGTDFYIGCYNLNGTASGFSDNRISCVQIGAAMGSTGNADWYDIMAALRAPPP